MVLQSKGLGALVLRLIAALALFGWSQSGSAAGTWSVIPFPVKPGEMSSPTAVAVDALGNLYVADQSNGGRIQKRDAQGSWSILATVGQSPGGLGGAGVTGLAVDAAGNLYVADYRIQKRDMEGNWSVLATGGRDLGQVFGPTALAVDAAGNLYIAEGGSYGGIENSRIEKRDVQGNWSVIASTGRGAGQVSTPRALAVDKSGNLYVADQPAPDYNGRIRKRDVHGNWSVVASWGSGIGQVNGPSALAVDGESNLYVGEYTTSVDTSSRIQEMDTQGNWSVIARAGGALGQVLNLRGLAVDTAGTLYVAEQAPELPDQIQRRGSNRIERRDAQGSWSLVAAAGSAPAELLSPPGQILAPSGITMDPAGSLYVSDLDSSRILKRDAQEIWSILAMPGDAAGQVRQPQALAMDVAGNLYVAEHFDPNGFDSPHGRIQKRNPQGIWSILAGEGTALGQVFNPYGLAVDNAGNLYVADQPGPYYLSGRIQKRGANGNWSVIATTGTDLGQVARPTALALDTAGSLYVAEAYYNGIGLGYCRIQKRDVQGSWSAIATQGTDPGQVAGPTALVVDTAGRLSVADYDGDGSRIQQRDAQGNWTVIATYGTDPGQVSDPTALAVDSAGNLYVADTGNNRVQEYTSHP